MFVLLVVQKHFICFVTHLLVKVYVSSSSFVPSWNQKLQNILALFPEIYYCTLFRSPK
jgi:hypothetical protein